MELPLRLKEVSGHFNRCWELLHNSDIPREQCEHALYWIKSINAVMEDLEASVLGFEKALCGDQMTKDRKRELDAEEASQDMVRRWLPVIMYGEMNRIEL
jgi:hypothetical protein